MTKIEKQLRTLLTDKQMEIYRWVHDFHAQHLVPPTRNEIAAAFQMWPSGAQGHIDSMIKKGVIARDVNIKTRNIRLLNPLTNEPLKLGTL